VIVDLRLTPDEAKFARVWVDGVEVTAWCYSADTVTGTAWVYKVDNKGNLVRDERGAPVTTFLTGVVRVQVMKEKS
jgi:hypothetical protein